MKNTSLSNELAIIESVRGFRELFEEKIEHVITQTTKTNGNVIALRSDVDGLLNRESKMNGGFKVLMGVISICSVIFPFVYYLMIANLKYEINENMSRAMSQHTSEADKKFDVSSARTL